MDRASSVSYIAADTLPIKMLIHPDTKVAMETGKIIPTHIQLVLTNKCNLLCPFCSYGAVDRKLELTYLELLGVLRDFADLGTEAVTITGGGEPTLHPDFDKVVETALDMNYKVGLITNGTVLERVNPSGLNQMIWCRISCSDHWDYSKYENGVRRARRGAPAPDWGMSYVVLNGGEFRPDNFIACVRLALELDFAYVRVVSDLTNPESATHMDEVRQVLVDAGVDDGIVIYQGRKNITPGFEKCWISLVKPYITADGGIFGCCGIQYSEKVISFDTPAHMRMGTIQDIRRIWALQQPFDGRRCVRCHYHQYNVVWGMLKQGINHEAFI